MSLWLVAKEPIFEVHMGYSQLLHSAWSIYRKILTAPLSSVLNNPNIFPPPRMESVKPFQLVFPWQSKARLPSPHSIQLASRQMQLLQSWPVDPESYRTLLGHLCTSLLILPS